MIEFPLLMEVKVRAFLSDSLNIFREKNGTVA